MAFALVTPASRGIGFALTRHLLATTPASLPIIATARRDLPATREKLLADLLPSRPASQASQASQTTGGSTTAAAEEAEAEAAVAAAADRLDLVHCDLESESSIAELAAHIRTKYMQQPRTTTTTTTTTPHLRLAICLPGMLVPERSPEKLDHDTILSTLKLNLLTPMLLAKHLTPFLPRKSSSSSSSSSATANNNLPSSPIAGLNPTTSILAFMSARVGSITDNHLGGWYSYRSSKAGLNQFVKSLDIHLQMRSGTKAMSVAIHPGTVKTAMSKEFWNSTPKEKLFEPEYSAERLVQVLRELDVETDRGKCWDWKGEVIPP